MSRVIYQVVVWHVNESCDMSMSRVTYEWDAYQPLDLALRLILAWRMKEMCSGMSVRKLTHPASSAAPVLSTRCWVCWSSYGSLTCDTTDCHSSPLSSLCLSNCTFVSSLCLCTCTFVSSLCLSTWSFVRMQLSFRLEAWTHWHWPRGWRADGIQVTI